MILPCSDYKCKGDSNENRTPATKWQWNLFYSKVIARNANTFIPLGDETFNSSLVERGKSLMDPQPHPLLHFLVQMRPTSTNIFLQVAKSVEVTRGKTWAVRRMLKCFPAKSLKLSLTRLTVCGQALSFKRMITSDSIPGRSGFITCSSTLSHQETNHTSLIFFAYLLSNAGRTHFALRSPPEQ